MLTNLLLISLLYYIIDWNPNPYVFELGGGGIKWYGLMYALAIMSGYFIALRAYRIDEKDPRYIVRFIGYQFLCAMIGARLWTVFFYEWSYFSEHPMEIIQLWRGGLSSHGAILGIFLSVYLFHRNHKSPGQWWSLDVLSIIGAVTAAFIRLGNLFNSEIVGTASDLPWAFRFVAVDDIARHPVVLYESLFYFAFAMILWIGWKRGLRRISGLILGIFMAGMLTARIILEYLKQDASITQAYSLPFILFGVGMIIWALRSR